MKIFNKCKLSNAKLVALYTPDEVCRCDGNVAAKSGRFEAAAKREFSFFSLRFLFRIDADCAPPLQPPSPLWWRFKRLRRFLQCNAESCSLQWRHSNSLLWIIQFVRSFVRRRRRFTPSPAGKFAAKVNANGICSDANNNSLLQIPSISLITILLFPQQSSQPT